MRNKFAEVLLQLMEQDDKVVLLYADIGNRLFNKHKELAPDRVINAGIAEANMASMAAGMAKMGLKPVIYTITPFTTARNFEQIKIDIAYQNLPVTIVGTGSGLAYANLGPTHHSFEDIALMRVLPNMQVVCPCDSNELSALLPQAIASGKPCYLRIGKKNEPLINVQEPSATIGKVNIIKRGLDVCILAVGTIIDLAVELQHKLEEQGKDVQLVSFHTVKPLDSEFLLSLVNQYRQVIILEEHSKHCGAGSAIFEWQIDNNVMLNISHFAIDDKFIDQVGSTQSARIKAGLSLDFILNKLKNKALVV